MFKLDFVHTKSEAEQLGIDFVTETQKQTNVRPSTADKDGSVKLMYYYMVLVLGPEFSAKEIRDAKTTSASKNAKGRKAGIRARRKSDMRSAF